MNKLNAMKTTLNFLKEIKKNNNKDWFDAHKTEYLKAKTEYEEFIDGVIQGLQKFDKRISADLKGKECLFRIYKDVRFSKDKTPYKTNFGASMNPGGKKSLIAGYYLHLEPGASFLAGGMYMPEPEMLQAVRQEIDYNAIPLLKILKSASFKKYFKGIDEEGKLVNGPKGFDKEHPHLELLKNRHFIVSYALSDKQIMDVGFQKTVVDGFKAMYPFLEYLRKATD